MNKTEDIWGTVFMKNGEIVTRTIGGETLLVPIRGKLADMQKIFSLNSMGEIIWQQLDGRKPLGEIRDAILNSHDAEVTEVETDIRDFISALLHEELIVGAGPL